MNEKIISLDAVEPVEIYGVNDVKLNVIKNHFPKLKLIARGYSLKVLGEASEIARFEKKLELLVGSLEKGDLSLEDSLKAFEAGISLTRQCQQTLAAAEQKVQLLVEKNGALKSEPFDDD